MLTRLNSAPNQDLVAAEARYHRKKNCLATYLNTASIAAAQNQTPTESPHIDAIEKLIEEFKPSIEKDNCVILLSTLRKRLWEILEEKGVKDVQGYSSQRLKVQLQKLWPEVVYAPQV